MSPNGPRLCAFLCLTLIVNQSPWLQLGLLNPQNISTGRSLSVYLLLSVPVVLAYLLNLLLLRLRLMDFTGGSDGKESACNAGDSGSALGWRRSPGEGMATHSSVLAWRIPWTEEPGGYSPHGRKESDTTEQAKLHFHRQI